MRRAIFRFDEYMTHAVQSISSAWFGRLMAAATFMANGPVLTILGFIVMLRAWQLGQQTVAMAVGITIVLMYFYNAIKVIFRRARPQTPYAAKLGSTSFPSGHSADSAAMYGLLGYLLWVHTAGPGQLPAIFVGLILPILVGTSRVYLGAHFPTDVVVGWLLGYTGLLILIRTIGL